MTLVLCFGPKPKFCSFDLDQAEQKNDHLSKMEPLSIHSYETSLQWARLFVSIRNLLVKAKYNCALHFKSCRFYIVKQPKSKGHNL